MTIDKYLNDSGKFIIQPHIKKIRLDIGLSYSAPNSAIWLAENPDTLTIGIEPNKYAIETLIANGFVARQKDISFPFPHENFILLNLALDNVELQTKKPFYHMKGDVGVSSLLKPTKSLGYEVLEIHDVDTVSLFSIFERIDWNRFEYVELVKIDTQGKDLDIIKSAGKLLDKIVYLNCEINTFDHYEKNPKPEEYNSYLTDNGFEAVQDGSIVNGEVVDKTYINKKHAHLKGKVNYFVL